MPEPRPSSHLAWLPVASLLLAATLWGVFWYPLRLLETRGLPGIWVTLMAYLAAVLLTLPWMWRGLREVRRDPVALLVLALASGWCNASFIIAVIEGVVVRVVLLFYLSPLWTVLLGHWILGERLDRKAVLVLACAMAGGMAVLWDPAMGFPWPRDGADWLAISSGMAFALANVMTRKLQQVSLRGKTLWAWLGVVSMALLWILWLQQPLPQVSAGVWAGAGALGLFIVVMTVAVLHGVTHMPVHRSAVLLLFEIPAAAVSAQWLAGERLGPTEWLGGALIVLAALVAARIQLRGEGT